MIRYYSDKDNYISVTGVVESIKYDEDFTELYIGFDELSPSLDDVTLNIVGKNFETVQKNHIDKK